MSKSVFSKRERSLVTALFCGPSLTKQSDKDSTDLNKILSRYYPAGALPPANFQSDGSVNDLTAVTGDVDFHSMLNALRSAERSFFDLPLKIRKRFGSASNLFEFCSDPSNYDEAVSLGIVEKLNQKEIIFESGRPPVDAPKPEVSAPA